MMSTSFRRMAPLRLGLRSLASAAPEVKMVEVTVDGKKISVPADYTVFQACEKAGVRIPRFCYHDRLSIAGNCRMCLVEVVKAPKPAASCAMPLMPNMQILTDSPMVKKARAGVMEFLLANHPLDCPICDQGGECDLQDQSMMFGSGMGRFKENKRAVEDKNLGPLIKTIMTRCIHCTRCVRFAEEIAGVEDLGVTGRGNSMEIGTYTEKPFDSEISGNVVDVCPVGALTNKPYAFTARPWELQSFDSVDVLDAVGANVRFSVRGNKVLRILPRLNEDVNEEWLSDRSRFSYDGLQRQRLDTPMIRQGDSMVPCSWEAALETVTEKMSQTNPKDIRGLVGDLVDLESMVVFKDLLNKLGCDSVECRQDSPEIHSDFRSEYTFSSGIVGIEEADAILLVGTNPRMEAPLINARLRKATLHYNTPISYIGPEFKSTFPISHVGESLMSLAELAQGKVPKGLEEFAKAEKPLIVIGQSALRSDLGGNAEFIYATLDTLAKKHPLINKEWNGISFLQLHAARTGALDLGIVPGSHGETGPGKLYYLLGADEFDESLIPSDAFVIYQGHHGDAGASRADVILPGFAYTEKSATYVNMEGRPQKTVKAVSAPFDAREDWMILRALSEVLGVTLPYNDLDDIHSRISDIAPHLSSTWERESPQFSKFHSAASSSSSPNSALKPVFHNHWFTNPISRCSKTMAQCSSQLPNATNSYISK